MNDGTGNFTDPFLMSVELQPGRVRAGDLDADGDQDIVLSHRSQITVLLNNGFGVLANETLYVMGDRIEDITLIDIDGDGTLDIAASDNGFNGVTLLLNRSGP